jgi:uncharacterized integral membrane protein
MSDQTPAGGPGNATRKSTVSEKLVTPRNVIGLLIAVLAIWFVIANNTEIRVRLWVTWVDAKLWIVLLCTFAAGLLTGWLLKRRRTRR